MLGNDQPAGFCRTSVADQVIDRLRLAQQNNWIVSIEGPPGVGKTTAALAYAAQDERRVWYYATRRDTASKGPLFRELTERIAGFRSGQTRENVGSIIQEAERLYMEGRPVLLILDEAQNLNADTLEVLRSIHDEGVLALALMGNHTFTDRFNAERRSLAASPQFLSRLSDTLHLSAVTPDDAAAVARALGVPPSVIPRLAREAAGRKGLRIVGDVSTFAGNYAGGSSPTREHFEAAITFLCP